MVDLVGNGVSSLRSIARRPPPFVMTLVNDAKEPPCKATSIFVAGDGQFRQSLAGAYQYSVVGTGALSALPSNQSTGATRLVLTFQSW